MSWIIKGNHIAISQNDRIAHLEAIDVFAAIETLYSFENECLVSLSEYFPNITWTKIGKYAKIEVFSNNDSIELRVHVDNENVDFVNGQIIDQIIIDNTWYYVANADEINELICVLNIQQNGVITIQQYIGLLKRDFEVGIVSNKVEGPALVIGGSYDKPLGLNANLFEYQQHGFMWLDNILSNIGGCILGDEMGLGKTLQAIALMVKRNNEQTCLPSLVVAPVSLLDNWKNECSKFAPQLNVLIHHGGSRTGSPQTFLNYDVIVTSYGHVISDRVLFNLCKWGLLIIDEAQNIKNPHSERTISVKSIEAEERLAITGTPFENHLIDVWSILDFVYPNICSDEKTFKSKYSDDVEGAKKIEPVLSSMMLRRTVAEVANDLPEKIVIPQPIAFSTKEMNAYESLRCSLKNQANLSISTLQKLRMFCTHPSIVCEDNFVDVYSDSVKYQRTCEIIEEIIANHEKVLIFTSYQKMFDIFQTDFSKRFKVYVNRINGNTMVPDRQRIVNEFNDLDGPGILLLNPIAAGNGLNITGANHVIHYNLEWNPALEEQASARAYRRGQKRTTFIYRLYYSNSVEEIINERLDRKREIASEAVVGVDGKETDIEDIMKAIDISPLNGG